MISRPTARFEKFFLTPLSFLLPVVGLVSFFDKAWLVGGYFVLAWFWNALIGQSLHSDKTIEQLKQGGLTEESNILQDQQIPKAEYQRLAKAIFFTGLLLGISTTIVICHQDFGWFISISVGCGVWIIGVFIISAISIWRKT